MPKDLYNVKNKDDVYSVIVDQDPFTGSVFFTGYKNDEDLCSSYTEVEVMASIADDMLLTGVTL